MNGLPAIPSFFTPEYRWETIDRIIEPVRWALLTFLDEMLQLLPIGDDGKLLNFRHEDMVISSGLLPFTSDEQSRVATAILWDQIASRLHSGSMSLREIANLQEPDAIQEASDLRSLLHYLPKQEREWFADLAPPCSPPELTDHLRWCILYGTWLSVQGTGVTAFAADLRTGGDEPQGVIAQLASIVATAAALRTKRMPPWLPKNIVLEAITDAIWSGRDVILEMKGKPRPTEKPVNLAELAREPRHH